MPGTGTFSENPAALAFSRAAASRFAPAVGSQIWKLLRVPMKVTASVIPACATKASGNVIRPSLSVSNAQASQTAPWTKSSCSWLNRL